MMSRAVIHHLTLNRVSNDTQYLRHASTRSTVRTNSSHNISGGIQGAQQSQVQNLNHLSLFALLMSKMKLGTGLDTLETGDNTVWASWCRDCRDTYVRLRHGIIWAEIVHTVLEHQVSTWREYEAATSLLLITFLYQIAPSPRFVNLGSTTTTEEAWARRILLLRNY